MRRALEPLCHEIADFLEILDMGRNSHTQN
jgi:hypothetical protein